MLICSKIHTRICAFLAMMHHLVTLTFLPWWMPKWKPPDLMLWLPTPARLGRRVDRRHVTCRRQPQCRCWRQCFSFAHHLRYLTWDCWDFEYGEWCPWRPWECSVESRGSDTFSHLPWGHIVSVMTCYTCVVVMYMWMIWMRTYLHRSREPLCLIAVNSSY